MRRLMIAALLIVVPAVLFAQKQCKKGIPCGGSCIAAGKTCHISARPEQAAKPSAESTADTSTAKATAGDSTWVASSRGRLYYRNGCTAAKGLAERYRVFFTTEADAEKAGYARSKQPGC